MYYCTLQHEHCQVVVMLWCMWISLDKYNAGHDGQMFVHTLQPGAHGTVTPTLKPPSGSNVESEMYFKPSQLTKLMPPPKGAPYVSNSLLLYKHSISIFTDI